MQDPSFIVHFKNRRKAIQACQTILIAREEGLTNRQILELPFFLNLFVPEYVQGKTTFQLEIKLKNMARDLKSMRYDELAPEWHEFKTYFESTRRK